MKNRIRILCAGLIIGLIGSCICKTDKKVGSALSYSDFKESIKQTFNASCAHIDTAMLRAKYEQNTDRWRSAFEYLAQLNADSAQIGRYDLGQGVYAVVSTYNTKKPEDALFEAHRKYADIQYLLSGSEVIYVTKQKNAQVLTEYDGEKDIEFYSIDGGERYIATPQNYFIFFPNDIHRPSIMENVPAKVKKVVVKVPLN